MTNILWFVNNKYLYNNADFLKYNSKKHIFLYLIEQKIRYTSITWQKQIYFF